MAGARFCLDWFAGPNAQVELFSPEAKGAKAYQLKYTPPFRATLRPPVEQIHLGPGELDPLNQNLDQLVETIDARAAAPSARRNDRGPEPLHQMKALGEELLTMVLPPYVEAELRAGGLCLEIGIDEALVEYPWELMYDGDDFLCLKHAIGRFVNNAPATPMVHSPAGPFTKDLEPLSVLVVSVPNPQPRDGLELPLLSEAEAETEALCSILSGIDGIQLETLVKKQATRSNVFRALRSNRYQIIHFNGHAHADDKNPHLSSLVLHDENLSTGPLLQLLSRNPPILCFVNACETAAAQSWKGRYDIFNLARAFLEAGTYLLGSRWKINDTAAAEFARCFYARLLEQGEPLGRAVTQARQACKEAAPEDEFAWASYVLYGDPRVCFRHLVSEEPTAAAKPVKKKGAGKRRPAKKTPSRKQ